MTRTARFLLSSRNRFQAHQTATSLALRRALGYQATGPASPTATWERSARRVKNTDEGNPYMDLIRETHDPSMHLKTIEDELKSTIGKALGKQGDKILDAVYYMNEAFQGYQDLLEKHKSVNHPSVVEAAKQVNEHRAVAVKARWELMVHRQAVGFIVGNHQYVISKFPIMDALPVGEADKCLQGSSKPEKDFEGQLDWWQRIGRWR